ncbi:hypothetical protein V6N13_148494 [Hibiscus sabdariffa]|uniref:Uncharacterized protein n=1 Tax=Hibiscus sabdariffa TaxID=183260 RepID=A0ABR2TYN6_9ROSI
MGETRPVPRRESSWGMLEGEHRQLKAHRCNDRAEDVIQDVVKWVLFCCTLEAHSFDPAWEEPTDPYTYLQLDPPKREVNLE